MAAQDTALVLEGGGFRCMFTAGVLDVLMEHGLYDFGSVWGVSAGSISASSFKSRQIGRTARIMLAFRDDRRFMSFWSLLTTGNIAGGEFMYEEVQNVLDPCDVKTFNGNPTRMFSVASNVVFGTADYLECKSFPEDVAKVQPLVKWAAYLPPEQGTPKADELPTFYAAVVQDTAIPGDLATDTGIALANMTLAAWDKGVGSCIMGAIDKPALTTLLGIEEPQKLAFMVAFGYPTHKASIVPMTEQTGVKYYLDENRDYCVPKRSAEGIARSL